MCQEKKERKDLPTLRTGTIPIAGKREWEKERELKVREKIKTIKTTTLLRSARILRIDFRRLVDTQT